MKPQRRVELEQPHAVDHAASVARNLERGRMPRDLMGLLHWYEENLWLEIPSALHKSGVWHDAAGGSAIGSPALAEEFRRYLENSPRATDPDGFYGRPIAAALARMAGREEHSDGAMMAAYLRAVARAGFTYSGVAERSGIPSWVSETYTREALRRLWSLYRADAPAIRLPAEEVA